MFMRGYRIVLYCALLQPSALIAVAHPAQLLMGHIKVLQELKDLFASRRKKASAKKKPKRLNGRMTQTEAYLSIHQNDVNQRWLHELKKYESIIDTAMARERKFLDSHYVLYHGQRNELCLLQDFLKALFHAVEIHASAKDFEMMRAWFDAIEKVETNDYLKQHDIWSYNGKEIFCANLSLFGNLNNSTSCTFHYFISDFNLSPFGPDNFIKEIFNYFGFEQKYFVELLKLVKNIRTAEGRLFQVFIPKKKIDQFVYLSTTGATPWAIPIIDKEFDHALGRHRAIAPILDLYQTNPSNITNIDQLQARIICSKDLMLNPKSGIKVFEYTTIPHTKFESYHKNLAHIIDKMISSWIAINGNSWFLRSNAIKANTVLGKLFDHLLKDGHTFYEEKSVRPMASFKSVANNLNKKILA